MQNQMINPTPLTMFIQAVRAAEQTQVKEIKIPIQQARAMTLVLVELLDATKRDYETMFNELKRSVDSEAITVSMDGGGFNEPK